MIKKITLAIVASLAILSCESVKEKPQEPFEVMTNLFDDYAANTLQENTINSLAVAVYKDGKNYHNYYGAIDKNSNRKPNDSTLYEIASISKVFAGSLAARAVVEGKISLDHDVRTHLDGAYPNLEFEGQPIKIKHLLSHTLGFEEKNPKILSKIYKETGQGLYENRPIEYGVNDFLKELESMKLDKAPGTFYEYSSVGPELISIILEKVYNKSYGDLLTGFFKEIGMHNTYMQDYERNQENLITSYENGKLAPIDRNPLLGGAAGIISTLPDLIKFMQFQLESGDPLIKESTRELFKDDEGEHMGYLWDMGVAEKEGFYYQKSGTSKRVQSIILICPDTNYGMILIMNNVSDEAMGDWARLYNRIESDLIESPKTNLISVLKKDFFTNTNQAVEKYKTLIGEEGKYYSSPEELNNLGYELIAKEQMQSAISVFTLAVSEFPQNANLFDSLGEAYFLDGNYEKALINYQKSLDLNAANTNAIKMIERIKEEAAVQE